MSSNHRKSYQKKLGTISIFLTFLFLASPIVTAQGKTLEQLRRISESMTACSVSLSDSKCDLDLLEPSIRSSLVRLQDLRQELKGHRSTANTNRTHSSSGGCYDSYIRKPSPFMGNHGEVFVLSDGSVWQVANEYEYMYEYSPSVIICPSRNSLIVDDKKLNIQHLSGGTGGDNGLAIESNISGSWRGWKGDTIVRLVNGQIWEQTGLGLSLSLGLGNDVLIYEKGGIYFMYVQDESEPVAVERLK